LRWWTPLPPSSGPRPDARALAAAFAAAAARGDFAAALAALDGLLLLEPRSAALHYNRAVALRRLGRAEEALAAASRALALDGTHHNARFERAAALMDLGHSDARAAFEAYLARVPGDGDARLNLARLALRAGDPVQAFAHVAGLAGEAATLARAEALRDLGRLDEMEAALADVVPAAALKVRTQGAQGRLPLDPRRMGRG
jgi:tetratricopeptide (TPR) repeat protein